MSVTLDPGTTFSRSGGNITVTGGATQGKIVTIRLTPRLQGDSDVVNVPAPVPTTVGPVDSSETWSKAVPCPNPGEYTLTVQVDGKDAIERDITVT